jgi:hypothetical protein
MQGEAERALRCRRPSLPNRPHFDADSIDSAIPRPGTGGLTVGYGILIRLGEFDLRLLPHECPMCIRWKPQADLKLSSPVISSRSPTSLTTTRPTSARTDRLANTRPVVNDPSGTRNYARVPNRAADLARARAASTSRSRGSAAVTRASTRTRAVAATSSTARSKAALLALDGVLNPLSFLTNWSDAARISSSDAGGWKLNSVLMFLHISWSPPVGLRH